MTQPLKRSFLAMALAFALGATTSVPAAQDQLYGLGGQTTGRVGSITAEPTNAYAALYNPALLATSAGRRIAFSTTLAGARYASLGTVRIDSSEYRTTNGVNRDGEAKLPNFGTTLWSLGYRHGFDLPFWDSRIAGIGVTFSGPLANLRSFSSPTPYDFTTLRYGGSDMQFKGSASFGLEIVPKRWSLGAGATVFISSAGIADTVIAADNPTARMKMDVSMNSSWLVGSYWSLGNWNAAFVYRQRIRPQFAQQLEGQVDFAGTRVFNQPMVIESTLYFEPHIFEVELQRQFKSFKVSTGISYQLWSSYSPAYMQVSALSRDGSTRSTRAPAIPFRDVWVPRVSAEIPFGRGRWNILGGYQYRPTPIVDLSGSGNLLDSNTHVIGIGLGCRVAENFLGAEEVHINFAGQWHIIEKRTIEKVDPALIGSPGYVFKGNAYVVGLAAEMRI